MFEVTAKVVLPAAGVTGLSEGETDNVGVTPACVTVTVVVGSPATITETLATRGK